MLALARKYRPKRFADVAVQSHVANTLKGAIARGRVAPGYLLCGPRGVGKTTLARVLAMALNCERRQDLDRDRGSLSATSDGAVPTAEGEPCGECISCTRIWSGSVSLDVVEIDAASNRGVDDARELRERAMYAPSGEKRYKVYIVDEAHMLTREAWNALLKILEEPPPRVVFVFATTEPQKIAQAAAPVLSRLQRFDLKRIGPSDIKARLADVLQREQVSSESDALAMIARAADGSMRDALSLTDQVLAFGEGGVTSHRVRDALGLVAEDEYLALLDIIAERRAGDVFPAVARLVDLGVDLGQFLAGLGDMLRAQLAVSLGSTVVEVSDKALEALAARAGSLAAGDLLRMLNAIGDLEPNFRRSTQQQLLLEALLVRFALLDRTVDLESMLRELGGSGGGGPGGGGTGRRGGSVGGGGSASREASGSGRPAGGNRPASTARPSSGGGVAGPGDVSGVDSLGVSESSVTPSSRAEVPPASRVATAATMASATREPFGAGAVGVEEPPVNLAIALAEAAPPRASTSDLNTLVELWNEVVAAIRRERPMLGSLLERALPVGVAASGLLTLQTDDAGAFEALSAKSRDLLASLEPHILSLTRVQLRPPASDKAGPSRMTAESIKSDTLSALRRKDPLLAAAIEELDLELID